MVRKQKQKFSVRSIMLIGAFFASFVFVITFLIRASFASESITTVTASSEHANFESSDQGAWRVKKTANIIDNDNVELKLNVDTRLKGNGHAKDVLIMLDSSGSMTPARVDQVKSAIASLSNSLLGTALHNRMTLKSFNTFVYDVTPGFQDESIMFNLYMGDRMPAAQGGTNYYDAILSIKNFLEEYEPEENRDMVVVFITDGKPVENHPLEKAEFNLMKAQFPNVIFQGIQYEMGDDIINELRNVSDNQFASSMSNIEDVLFEAVADGEKYSQFTITDELESDYYEIISANSTTGSLSISGNTITWDMGGILRSGTSHSASIRLRVKESCHNKSDARCPVNRSLNIKSKLAGLPDEDVNFSETPVLQFRYSVHYNANLPAGCNPSTDVPADASHLIAESIELSNVALSCPNYSFLGWTIATDGVVRMNNNYFKMPESDVEIRALWGAPTISKSMEGTIKPKTTATFKSVQSYQRTGSGYSYNPFMDNYNSDPRLSHMSEIQAIKIADSLPADFTPTSLNTFSANNSELPIYGFYEPSTHTYYFYSDADEIYFNTLAEGIFCYLPNLTDISGLEKIHAENATSLKNLFYQASKLENISAIANWDTSNVSSMAGLLQRTKVQNLDAISGWSTDSLTSLNTAFGYNASLTDVSGIAGWDVSGVTDMGSIFREDTGLSTLADFSDWETGSVQNLAGAFAGMSNLDTLDGISDWDVKSVTNMSELFHSDKKITSLSQLSDWETDSLKNLSYAFYNMDAITTLSGLEDWDVDQVTNMSYMLDDCATLTSIAALADWQTDSLTDLTRAFSFTPALTSLAGLESWKTGNVWSLNSAFRDSSYTSLTPLSNWDTKNVTTMYRAFRNSKKLANLSGFENWNVLKNTSLEETFSGSGITNVEALANWYVYPSGATPALTTMREAFTGTKLVSLDGLDNWNVSRVTNMTSIFSGCTQLADINGVRNWDVSSLRYLSYAFTGAIITTTEPLVGWGPTTGQITEMEETFSNCSQLLSLSGLRTWRMNKVTTLTNAFYNCPKIESLDPLTPTVHEGTDYLSWSLDSLETLYGTFYGLSRVTSLEPLRNWTMPRLRNLGNTFRKMTSITSLEPLSNWLPSGTSVWTIAAAFYGVSSVTNLHGLETWDVRNVTNVGSLFREMSSLTDVSALMDWNTGKFRSLDYMFNGDYSLVSLNGLQNWNVESVGAIYYFCNGCSGMTDLSALNAWDGTIKVDSMASYDRGNVFTGVPSTTALPTWWHF